MRTSFSIACMEDGRLQMRVSGKLTGHSAREGLALLKIAAEQGRRGIMLDLRETTSLDSLGIAMLDWIRKQNGNLNVDIAPPIRGVSEDELLYIAQSTISGKKADQLQPSGRRERA
ncbi:MAG: hypothetical protein E3J72_09775 [Planctomycetota bacterium]|nr:MAG: hypothetical protein E3J72_09775 [Planctomycetota bacterium]